MTNETHRFFRLLDKSVYLALTQHVDSTRGYPDGKGTERGLPPWDELFLDAEEPPARLYVLDRWRFRDEDTQPLQSAIEAGAVQEIDLDEYLRRLHFENENLLKPTKT